MIRVSNGLDPDQDRHSVGPDLGPKFGKGCQQMIKVAASKESYVLIGVSLVYVLSFRPSDKSAY